MRLLSKSWIFGLLVLVACTTELRPDNNQPEPSGSIYGDVVFVVSQKGLTGLPQVTAHASFVNHINIQADHSARLLRLPGYDLPLGQPVDVCRLIQYDLREIARVDPDGVWLQLLDVGKISVGLNNQELELGYRDFPDIFPYIAGVTYRNSAKNGLPYQPGAWYRVAIDGLDDVESARIELQAPAPFRILAVGTESRLQENAEHPVSLTHSLPIYWDASDAERRSLFHVKLVTSHSDKLTVISCNAKDDGFFTIPSSLLARLPQSDGETTSKLLLQRIAVAPLPAGGLRSGKVTFVVESELKLALQ